MSTSEPWRALEALDEGSDEAAPGSGQPSPLRLVLAATAILVVGSLALVAFVEMRPSGQVDLVGVESTGSGAVGSQATVVVQVAGAVVRPGVYTLPTGSRVGDAIQAAGGYSTDVDPRAAETKLNLAARLQDAQLIVVPRRGDGASGSSGPGGSSAAGLINLNTATAAELDTLPGIGPATAAKIIASREERPFATVDDLVTRKLVSASTLAKFRDKVTV
jgi:competence protein ComEA